MRKGWKRRECVLSRREKKKKKKKKKEKEKKEKEKKKRLTPGGNDDGFRRINQVLTRGHIQHPTPLAGTFFFSPFFSALCCTIKRQSSSYSDLPKRSTAMAQRFFLQFFLPFLLFRNDSPAAGRQQPLIRRLVFPICHSIAYATRTPKTRPSPPPPSSAATRQSPIPFADGRNAQSSQTPSSDLLRVRWWWIGFQLMALCFSFSFIPWLRADGQMTDAIGCWWEKKKKTEGESAYPPCAMTRVDASSFIDGLLIFFLLAVSGDLLLEASAQSPSTAASVIRLQHRRHSPMTTETAATATNNNNNNNQNEGAAKRGGRRVERRHRQSQQQDKDDLTLWIDQQQVKMFSGKRHKSILPCSYFLLDERTTRQLIGRRDRTAAVVFFFFSHLSLIGSVQSVV